MKRVNSFFWVLFLNKQLKSKILKLKFQGGKTLVSFHKHRLLKSVFSFFFQPSSVSPVHSEHSQGSGQGFHYLCLHLLLSSDLSAPVSSPPLCWANTFQLNKENHLKCASLYSNILSYNIIITVVCIIVWLPHRQVRSVRSESLSVFFLMIRRVSGRWWAECRCSLINELKN